MFRHWIPQMHSIVCLQTQNQLHRMTSTWAIQWDGHAWKGSHFGFGAQSAPQLDGYWPPVQEALQRPQLKGNGMVPDY